VAFHTCPEFSSLAAAKTTKRADCASGLPSRLTAGHRDSFDV
jgi:hypothetical protein